MRYAHLSALVLALGGPSHPLAASTQEAAVAKPAFHEARTAHLSIRWKEGAASEEAVEKAKQDGERYFAALKEKLGYAPSHKVTILLQGPAEQPDGSWEYPRVDGWGNAHLFQYDPSPDSYFNALAHEMAHVFRRGRRPQDWFLEEGLAELLALRIDPSLEGFPWYGFPVDLVAGQWIAGSEDIPLSELRARHHALNLPCKIQSYALRSSFFDYLGRTYGDDAVLQLANEEPAGALEDYERFFGKPFDDLERAWRAAIRKEFDAIEDAEERARRYREETPAQYMRVCVQGDDF